MITYYSEKGEDYAIEKIKGYRNSQLIEIWGKPDETLSGLHGDIWKANEQYNIIVYYDNNSIVERVKFHDESDAEKWDIIPMVRIDGELYLDTGKESNATRKCGTLDGEITSSVDGNEVPTENNQSNFGTGYGYPVWNRWNYLKF